MVIDEPHSKLHLVMGIIAVVIENYQLPSIDFNAKIAFPEVAVGEAGPDLVAISLKCSKKPGNNVLLYARHCKL